MVKPKAAEFDLELAILDPASFFRWPEDVVRHPRLVLAEKIEILCRWAYDATELAVAEEEGMGGGEPSEIHAVMAALGRVTGGFDVEHTGPTKHAAFCVC